MVILIVFLVILAIILLIEITIFIISFLIFKKAFSYKYIPNDTNRKYLTSPDKKQVLIYDSNWIKSKPFEIISIKSNDNLNLYAHYLKKENSHKYILSIHGYHGNYQELSIPCKYLYEQKGFNLIMIEQRCHALSQGKYITFGIKECEDVLLWINKILEIDNQAKICLFGCSMGASTIFNTIGFNLPSNVCCCITDSPYSSLKEELNYLFEQKSKLKLLNKLIYLHILLLSKIHHFNLNKYDTHKQLNNSKTPILLIHGDQDNFVPFYMLDINYKNANNSTYKQKEIFPNAWHCMEFIINYDRYIKIITDFIDKFIY